jgi:hypothetical protein
MLVLVLLVLERNEALELFKIEAAAQEGPIGAKFSGPTVKIPLASSASPQSQP